MVQCILYNFVTVGIVPIKTIVDDIFNVSNATPQYFGTNCNLIRQCNIAIYSIPITAVFMLSRKAVLRTTDTDAV